MDPEPSEARRMNTLLERIESQLSAVAENHGALRQGIGELRQAFDQRIGFLENAVTEGFKRLNARMDAHEHSHRVA